jgi:hypothetical protein
VLLFTFSLSIFSGIHYTCIKWIIQVMFVTPFIYIFCLPEHMMDMDEIWNWKFQLTVIRQTSYSSTLILSKFAHIECQWTLQACIFHSCQSFITVLKTYKFLGLQTDNHLTWKNHTDLMIPKLSTACYAIRSMSHISSTDTLKSIYFAYYHSIMKYGIIFWGNSPNSRMIFTLQKRTVTRIIAGVKSRT